MRSGRLRARLVALSLSLALSFVAGELLVRLSVGVPLAERLPVLRVQANRHRGWEMVPGEAHYTYMQPVSMNALGLRGPELAEEKGDELRALALGDSLVYGQGVSDEETVPQLLERELARRTQGARPWRVVNAGHRGYGTNQELGLLRELGARIRPDLVLLFWFWNDLDEPDIAKLHERLARTGPVAFDTNAPLEGRAKLLWRLKQIARRSALAMFLHDLYRGWRAEPRDPALFESRLLRFDGELGTLQELSQGCGARLVLIAIPDSAALRGPHPSVGLTERALALVRAKEIPALDLLAPLRARFGADRRLPIIPFDGHYTPHANRALAEEVAVWLVESGALAGR